MAIIYSSVRGRKAVLTYDKDNIEVYPFYYRPQEWLTDLEVTQNELIVVPTVPNGCMYVCSQGGITGALEPVWPTNENGSVVSGTAKFRCLPYGLLLKTGDIIQSYEILPVTDLVIDNDSLIDDSIIRFRVTDYPLTAFDLTIRIIVLRASGITTQYDDTISFTPMEN